MLAQREEWRKAKQEFSRHCHPEGPRNEEPVAAILDDNSPNSVAGQYPEAADGLSSTLQLLSGKHPEVTG
ncbi:hypothetical protein SBA5_50098 [Candidatus Sulfotelmatomonas gaucii]|uniref:Uncharacterized protein n=1 Tax=Candidatus Sulfuritelmatomonas gaucii TaxID=2043161 RepID=A0A2N9LQH3_9BACT|nr:hypothetical protein SBA5_50098 [Candidatus Sulfotelmatomonas gaucii]